MQSYRCWTEIDCVALRENLLWIRDQIGPKARIMTVVKADAYGHGLKQIAALLMRSGTDVFGVANLGEARSIRSVGKGWPVLMLGACLPDEVETAVRDHVMPTISSVDEAKRFSEAAVRLRKTVDVHVKVDTGMGRLGAPVAAAADIFGRVAELEGLRINGLYTHFSSAEDDADFSAAQSRLFRALVESLKEKGVTIPNIHANNSAAVLHEPDTVFNLIRPGLLVYGIVPEGKRSGTSSLRRHLRPALNWKTRVIFVKEIGKGTPISYGQTFRASRKMKVATVGAGYADGYLRSGSNRAEVLVGGKRCRVLGRVTMDQMVVDVSRVPNVRVGDEAVLIGSQGNERITASELAEWFETIPWEVLTHISHRVMRIYRGEHAA